MNQNSDSNQRPIVAITMGAPAGIGPELCLRALAEPDLLTECLPVVFGDSSVLSRVAEACGLPQPAQVLTLADWKANPHVTTPAVWVGDKSLHQTDFANDPEYPATTSNVKEILFQRSGTDIAAQWPVDVLLPGGVLPSSDIVIGESTCVEDLVRWSKNLDRGTLPAGAAEFFAAFLALNGYEPTQKISSEFAHSDGNLFVCGSTSIASRLFCQQCESSGTPVLRMPVELFDPSFRPTRLIDE